MGITSGIVVYVIAWWLIFFMALPIGVRPPHEAGEAVETGHEPGAPVRPRIWIKALAATVLAAIVWLIMFFCACTPTDIISLFDIALRLIPYRSV